MQTANLQVPKFYVGRAASLMNVICCMFCV